AASFPTLRRRRPPPRQRDQNRPRDEEYPWRRRYPLRERVSTIRRLLRRRWWRDTAKSVHRLEYDRFRARAIHLSLPSQLVPDLAVVAVRRLEQSAPALRRILDGHGLHRAPELRQDTAIEIGETRILGREMDRDFERRVDAAQRGFVGARK